jgi:hypothetical protein
MNEEEKRNLRKKMCQHFLAADKLSLELENKTAASETASKFGILPLRMPTGCKTTG